MKRQILLSLLFIIFPAILLSQNNNGVLRGIVTDDYTQNPIENALVEILNSDKKDSTNKSGEFLFDSLNFDSYQIKISAKGYDPVIKSGLIYASKPLELKISLTPKGTTTEVIEVEANYFRKNSEVNISSLNLDFEEIRRAPGATEDVSRMLEIAPGVSTGNDQRNDLIVRGGSPAENLILIDGIEISNINHFGSEGSSSGAISFINIKFVSEANMLTGGFPSLYGDRLSSVIDVKFREGSRKKFYSDLNLSIAGFGGMFEGPISTKGSVLFSVRRSYLELVHKAIQLTSVPNFWDFNLKANYDFTPKDKMILIGFAGLDKIDFSGESAENNPYGNSTDDQRVFATGINYRHLLSKGYIQTVVSDAYTNNYIVQIDGQTALTKFKNKSYQNEVITKSDLNYELSRNFILNTGFGAKLCDIHNDLFLRGDTSAGGYYYDTIKTNMNINSYKLFSHFNFTTKLFNDILILNTGARVDYFDYIRLKTTFSPRVSASVKLTPVTSLNAAYGIYYQTPVYYWISAHPNNFNLNSIRNEQYVLGLEQYFSNDIKASAEVYYKKYRDYPVWKDIPYYILIDGGSDFGPNLIGEAVSAGNGFVKGFDISIQKKLSNAGLYGFLNYSYVNSGFTALAGGEKPGAFDCQNQFTLIAGYQFSNGWLLGTKIRYAGGRPYTPFDYAASKRARRGVYATSDFNSVRYPDYLRFDLRVDKKFDFSNSSLVAYVEVQNIFNRNNIYEYFWNKDTNSLGTVYQWAFLPLVGMSVQF